MNRKKFGLLALGLGLALTSCSGSHQSPAATASSTTNTAGPGGQATTSQPTASGTPIVATTTTSIAATGSSTASSAPAGPPRCATSSLAASLTGANGTAGSIYYALVATNRGSAACILQGWPGVSFVTGTDGQQVGAPASRIQGSAPDVTVAAGGTASAVLQITEASNYGSGCDETPVTGLRVYPPDQTAALFVSHADHGCANSNDVVLHVGAFQPSPSG